MVSKNTRETKRNKNLKERGITLIALIVTIIVLLILAGISIQILMGDSGILKKVTDAATNTDIADYKEKLDLLGEDLLIDDTVKGKTSGFLDRYKEKIEGDKNFENSTVTKEDDDSLRVETEEGYVFKITEEGVEYLGEGDEATKPSHSEVPPLEKGKTLYADIDNDENHTPDAVIYADLSVGGSGKWGNDSNVTYSYAKETGTLKQYKVVNESYIGDFGEGKVIAPVSEKSGSNRYYAMALSDVDNHPHYWYYAAYTDKIEEYSNVAPTDFGKGITNTKTMIDAWKNKQYGLQNTGANSYPDMWGLSGVTSKYDSTSKWFVPSIGEWAAFADHFNITDTNYQNLGLKDFYWSSSLYSSDNAWIAYFFSGGSEPYSLTDTYYVRLSVTF